MEKKLTNGAWVRVRSSGVGGEVVAIDEEAATCTIRQTNAEQRTFQDENVPIADLDLFAVQKRHFYWKEGHPPARCLVACAIDRDRIWSVFKPGGGDDVYVSLPLDEVVRVP